MAEAPDIEGWERGLADYRTKARQEAPSWYSGWAHLGSTTVGALVAIVYAASRVRAPSPREWLWIPATFLAANLVEFLMHRGPMHHPFKYIEEIYVRHTLQHHRFFPKGSMVAQSPRDFKAVLFPPAAIFLFLGVIGGPIGATLFFLASPNAGWFFVATAVSYFLTYEWLHLAYHLPEESLVGGLPGLAYLRRHHTFHHDLRLMSSWNFNITFPICDELFGTTYRG